MQDRKGEGAGLGNLGQVAEARGQLAEAEAYFQQNLDIAREVQDRQGEGVGLFELARIAEAHGDLERAESLHRASLAIAVEVQDDPGVAASLRALGQFLIERRRQRDDGCELLHKSIAMYHAMGLPTETQVRAVALRLGCDVGEANADDHAKDGETRSAPARHTANGEWAQMGIG